MPGGRAAQLDAAGAVLAFSTSKIPTAGKSRFFLNCCAWAAALAVAADTAPTLPATPCYFTSNPLPVGRKAFFIWVLNARADVSETVCVGVFLKKTPIKSYTYFHVSTFEGGLLSGALFRQMPTMQLKESMTKRRIKGLNLTTTFHFLTKIAFMFQLENRREGKEMVGSLRLRTCNRAQEFPRVTKQVGWVALGEVDTCYTQFLAFPRRVSSYARSIPEMASGGRR